MEEWDKELDDLHVKNGDLNLRNQDLECELAKLAAINPKKSGAIGPDLSNKVDAAELLNQLKARRKRSRVELGDVEMILEMLAEADS
ncbi:MAG: flagellar alpha dynein [Oscillatoriales cyanobacterium RU_3_3]|nr:flagellar alpha dynein [Oscillatoriales cyanobacterium RU_3_3]